LGPLEDFFKVINNMRLIKKGGQNSQIDINARIFSPQVIEIS
jgi:hypothetical protein